MMPIVITITPIATDMSAKWFQVICRGFLPPSPLTSDGDRCSDDDHEHNADGLDESCKLIWCHWVVQTSADIINPREPERKF
jgi:hypothetical protein